MIQILHSVFEYLAPRVGASPDELKLIFSFLASYPLAGVLKRIPDDSPDVKNVFIIATSLFYLVGLFDLWDGVRTLAISAVGTYAIALYLQKSPVMPWIGFAFVMGHMSVSHVARQAIDNPSVVDITGAQMVLVMKLSAFCWNVADGQLPGDQLSDFQRDKRLLQLPGLVEYTGYVLFFPSLFAGPAFDFVEYQRWIDTSMFDISGRVEASTRPPAPKKRKIPRSATPALWKAAGGLLWLALFIYLSPRYDATLMARPGFMSHGFFGRLGILYMTGVTARLKYYGVWSLTEGACILAGLGFNGVDATTGQVSWNRLQNINPWAVETAQNPRAYLGNWNINTNNWLRNYVYLRVTPRGKKPGFKASLITFGTSALWHGFYPGYYLTFVLASLVQTVAKNFRRYIRPFFLDHTGRPLPGKWCYDILSLFATQLTFSFITAPFLILSFSASLQVWTRMYCYAIVGTLLSMVFFASPAKHELRKKLDQRQAKAGGKMVRTLTQDSFAGREPLLGLSADPQRDISEIMEELKADANGVESTLKASKT